LHKIAVIISIYRADVIRLHSQLESIQNCILPKQCYVEIIARIDNENESEEVKQTLRKCNVSIIDDERNIGYTNSYLLLLKKMPSDFDFIFICDQDDLWLENKLHLYIDEYNKSNYDLCFSDSTFLIDNIKSGSIFSIPSNKLLLKKYYQKKNTITLISLSQICYGHNICITKNLHLALKKHLKLFNYSSHDRYILYYSIIKKYKISILKTPCVIYIQHKNQSVGGIVQENLKWPKRFKNSICLRLDVAMDIIKTIISIIYNYYFCRK
jgi:hypothetical protein